MGLEKTLQLKSLLANSSNTKPVIQDDAPVIHTNSIFLESRSNTLPELPDLLPQFQTNHKEIEGVLKQDNELACRGLLDNLLEKFGSDRIRSVSAHIVPNSNSLNSSPASSPIKKRPTLVEKDPESIGDYQLLQVIGEGAFGKVRLAIHIPTNSKIAIKCISKSQISKAGTSERLVREILCLSHLIHPNITTLLQIIDTQKTIHLCMTYESRGELFEFITKYCPDGLPEQISRHFFRQMISAVRYCHSNGVIHRDLKLENLLLDRNWNLKIIDFGFSNITHPDNKLNTFCGSGIFY